MSEKRGQKRPKSYYLKCAQGGKKKHLNDLDAGMKGFLVTCNKYEKETVREMYNILNEYADKKLGPEVLPGKKDDSLGGSSDDEDIEKAMAREASELKQVSSVTNTERRFQNTSTKTNNCIFIRTTLDDPAVVAHDIFTEIIEKQEQKARYALRMVPIQVTCKTNMDSIKKAAETLFKSYFETEFGVGLRYEALCKVRNNSKMSKYQIVPAFKNIIQEMNPLHLLTHENPDLVIVIEIIRNICCLSVVKDYHTFRKYNLHEVLKTKDTGEMEDCKVVCKDQFETEVPTIEEGKTEEADNTNELKTNKDDASLKAEDEKKEEINTIETIIQKVDVENKTEENNTANIKDKESVVESKTVKIVEASI